MSFRKGIKGLDPKHQSFVWNDLGKIRELQAAGNYAGALERATTLIAYLPQEAKQKLLKKAEAIRKGLLFVSQMKAGTDEFTRGVIRHRRLQVAGSALFDSFVRELTDYLDDRGYMEQRYKKVPGGRSRTDV